MADDYTKPGNDGGKKPRKPDHKVDVAFVLPHSPTCGKPYLLRVKTQQLGICDLADYKKLYTRAEDVARSIADKFNCSTLDGCTKRTVQRAAAW